MATTTSFSGLGSGIDFNTIRDAILDQKARPVTLMQNKASNINSRIEALKQLNTSLAALTTASEALTNRDLGTGRSTTTGDANVVTASASSTANLGNYDINVTRLATNLTQASRSFASPNDTILAGSATTATFELRKGGAAEGVSITIDSSNNTLAGLRDAINSKNAGVTATIVDVDGTGANQQLVLTSKETGTKGRVELVETTATGTLTDLNLRAINPPDGNNSNLDASFTINGLPLTRSTNSITDAVTGLTLNLKKAGAASVGVIQSTDTETKLRAFVTAYNAVQDFVAGQYKKDAKDRPTGVLAGDSTLRGIQQQLKSAVQTISEDNGGAFNSLTQIGITTGNDGKLTFDSTVFNDKLKNNPDDVKALLFGKTASDSGIFQAFKKMSSGLSDDVTGSVRVAIKGYENSVKTLNATISSRLESLNRLKDSLTKQFSAADAAIGQLNGQGTALTSIIDSLNNSNNKN
ncbi:MAG TPA: flagellar filament capping protein FliD [Pyrinomonadaceae bacterium]|nr:flagellar filament capping protein FliD [Pyrinomonadaceae bacterium]